MITENSISDLASQGFEQVCIWPGTLVVNDDGNPPEEVANLTKEERIQKFEDFMKEQFGVRAKYLEEVRTKPDLDSQGFPIQNTGGRNDLFFLVHSEDIGKFAVPRLQAGIRWYEDVVSYNGHANLYPKEILEKYEVRW